MMQAGLNSGQWMSQFNARLVCGASLPPPNSTTPLSQSGPDGWCSSHKNLPNYNAQLLIEDPNSTNGVSVSGPNPYANAATCLANSRLSGTTYPYWKNSGQTNAGLGGYKDYMSWVKSEVIHGHQVTIGVLVKVAQIPNTITRLLSLRSEPIMEQLTRLIMMMTCCILTTTVATHLSAAS